MTKAEFFEKHRDAAAIYMRPGGPRLAVQYRRVVSTDPLTLDNRAFGWEDGEEVELLPWHLREWMAERDATPKGETGHPGQESQEGR